MSIKKYKYPQQATVKLSEHFIVREFASTDAINVYSTDVLVDDKLINILEKLYTTLNCSKIVISSGYRTRQHDINVGGNGSGQHTKGTAADFCCYGSDNKPIPAKFVCCALEDFGDIYGIGYISYFYTHVDTRSKYFKWWGDETVSGSPSISRIKPNCNSWYDYFDIPKPFEPVHNNRDYSPVFNATYYRAHHPDVVEVFGTEPSALFYHFIHHGITDIEGRQASAEFNWKFYKHNYADLAATFGNSVQAYYEHYIDYGKQEGRIANRMI